GSNSILRHLGEEYLVDEIVARQVNGAGWEGLSAPAKVACDALAVGGSGPAGTKCFRILGAVRVRRWKSDFLRRRGDRTEYEQADRQRPHSVRHHTIAGISGKLADEGTKFRGCRYYLAAGPVESRTRNSGSITISCSDGSGSSAPGINRRQIMWP